MSWATQKAKRVSDSSSTYHHGNLKEALVQAAIELLEEGIPASDLSLRMVARRAGVSHAAPYAHFEDKEDLIASIKDVAFSALLEDLKARLSESKAKARDRLMILARTYLTFAAANPGKFDLMFRRPLQKSPGPGHRYAQSGKAMFAILTALVQEFLGGGTGEGCGVSPAQLKSRTLLAWSALHGICMLRVGGLLVHVAPERAFDDVAADIVAEMLKVLEADASP